MGFWKNLRNGFPIFFLEIYTQLIFSRNGTENSNLMQKQRLQATVKYCKLHKKRGILQKTWYMSFDI